MTDDTPAAVAAAVTATGYSVVTGPALFAALRLAEAPWAEFAAFWDDLVTDRYVGPRPADQYRQRRYGRLALHRDDADAITLTPLPDRQFVQAAEHIPRYGGAARQLARASAEFLAHPLLRHLVAWDYTCLPEPAAEYEVGLHLIRVVVGDGLDSRPTPEGRHRDGHTFVAMHLISRNGCEGGETRVYRQGGDAPLAHLTLRDPLDTVVVDDRVVEHEVTPVRPAGATGQRDVLLVTFYPPEDPP